MELENPQYLFDRKDPSPMRGRDLNEDVESYILDSLREIPPRFETSLKVTFRKGTAEQYDHKKVSEAIANYFKFSIYTLNLSFKHKIKRGFQALFVGLSFLFTCIYLSHFIEDKKEIFWNAVHEGLIVIGWVSMWHPVQIFLYEWWPIITEQKLTERAVNLDIQIEFLAESETSSQDEPLKLVS